MQGIPVIDFARFGGNAQDRLRCADELGEVFRKDSGGMGFAAIMGHGVPDSLIARAFSVMERVFVTDMTEEERLRYEFPKEGRQMGYTPHDTEYSKGHKKPNRMQFWHVNDPESIVRNEFPHEVPEFGPTMLELHRTLKQQSAEPVLRALAMHLRRDPEFFVRQIQKGENLVRPIFYPALRGDEEVERSGGHEDINLITILVPATEPGLQVLGPDGQWVDANNPPGSLIVNLGDMMQMHTFGELKSTTHRVVNPGKPCPNRFSIPIFVHAENIWPVVTAGAYKFRRLREINLLAPLEKYAIDH